MQPAEYPTKSCREPLFNQVGLGYTCELPMMHPGPCASLSLKPSVEARDRWEAAHPEWEKDIGNMDIEI